MRIKKIKRKNTDGADNQGRFVLIKWYLLKSFYRNLWASFLRVVTVL